MNQEISLYQYWRKQIPNYLGRTKSFKNAIDRLSTEAKIGLIREQRAYLWLKKKYKNDLVSISTSLEDQNGIDIVIERDNEFKKEFINFAISGPTDHEMHSNCNYKIIVTDNKIYQKRVKNV